MNNLGTMVLHQQNIEMGDDYYRMIVDAEWQGPPVTLINRFLLEELPDWAVSSDGEMIQIGPYVLRNTGVYEPAPRAFYCYRVDSGLEYWLWWRLCQSLDFVWRRILLTLAVWGLAQWPRQGEYPTWRHVLRRWHQ
jgi:hypothetical protein